MRFYFHVVSGRAVEYDREGHEFASLEAARKCGVEMIRNFLLAHNDPPPHLITKSMLCIINSDGHTETVPFIEALRTSEGMPVIHLGCGHA